MARCWKRASALLFVVFAGWLRLQCLGWAVVETPLLASNNGRSQVVPLDGDGPELSALLVQRFDEARTERRHHNHQRARELYDKVVVVCGNATSAQRQLRMWAQYEYASLLMASIVPLVPRVIDRTRLQRQVITKFHEALALSETVHFSGTSRRFGASERLHAFNSMGLAARELNEPAAAIEFFQRAVDADASAYQPFTNLAVVYLDLGRIESALDANMRALERNPDDAVVLHNMATVFYARGDEARAQMWWERTLAIDPRATEAMASLASVHGAQGNAERARELLTRAVELAPPEPALRSYQLQLALSQLRMVYESPNQLQAIRQHFEVALLELLRDTTTSLPNPIDSIGSGSMGYYAIYQGYDDKRIRHQLAQVYYDGARDKLDFIAPHVATTRARRLQFQHSEEVDARDTSALQLRRRIRVGFLSQFLYYHSVGLLLSGVIRFLTRDRFEVFVIAFESSQRDHVSQQLQVATEPNHWIVLPQRDLERAQRRIAALELDVLVFGEIGMHAETYFLAFARLALRSVLFWGHAITSGIAAIDYFVSSTLFRRDLRSPSDQERYTECLYEMEGLTTVFPRPEAPATGLSRASFVLPEQSVMPHMVLVPQTLYKLHPDFDRIIQRVLARAATSFLVLPIGQKPLLVEQLTRRWRRGGIVTEHVYKRIFFVRPMNRTEFLALCEMAAIVLDPFPVGGGRSSFEVFSVGTPILALSSRTTILQLTLGMYRRMGINASCCVFEDEDELVEAAAGLLRDRRGRDRLETQIRQNSYKLYEASNARVVREWELLFTRILAHDPPTPLTHYRDANVAPKRCPSSGHEALRPRVVYEELVDIESLPPRSQLVRLHDDEDPFVVAADFTGDMLQAAFLGKVLWNAQQRFRQRVVDTLVFRSRVSGAAYSIEIRQGDDLHQIVRWQIQQQLLQTRPTPPRDGLDALVDQVLGVVAQRVPQHTSAAWRDARAIAPMREFVGLGSNRRDCVALAVTTCKRLGLFQRTMRSLAAALGVTSHAQWFDHFCVVLVVDDNSSDHDRRAICAMFPRFSFMWKTPHQRGHAMSLNLALRALAQVRFLLYVEDDWAFRTSETPRNFVEDAVAVLRSTRLVQVLLNDQYGGYEASLGNKSSRNVSYAVHEFGVLDASHTFSYWPGFSLNPGVWDLAKLSWSLNGDESTDVFFEEDTDIFERKFALRVWRAGLEVGYLHGATLCDHIGTAPSSSAYVLNGLPRRFD